MREPSTPRWVLRARLIFLLQIASIAMMWVFVLSISVWILHLNRLSRALHDVPSASAAISIVAIPVFLTGAGVLTYVFFGLMRGGAAGEAAGEQEQGR